MKNLILLALIAPLVGCTLPAQTAAASAEPPPPPGATVVSIAFTQEQLDQLLAPIALYPDPLIALILPASTNTADVVLAARYLQAGGDPAQAESQPWDDSVQALAHYPQVIRWMDENLAWTKQLGEAFATQPTEVMNTVQRLRARAKAAGTLTSTPQQQVVYQGAEILIVPAQPDVIYVPYYDPSVVYIGGRYGYPYDYFGFSTGFVTGWWLSYGFDWNRHRLWTIGHNDRERVWREHRGDWFNHHDWDRDWDHDRSAPRRDRPPVVHTWQPRPEHREWRHEVSPTQAPRVPTIARPSIPRARWNDAPKMEISRQSSDPQRRWRTPTTTTRSTSSNAFVGPTAPAGPQVTTETTRWNEPARPATGPQRADEDRGRRYQPANGANRYVPAPGYVRPSAPAAVFEPRAPQSGTNQAAPAPRPAPALRNVEPARNYAAPAQSYSPPTRSYSPPTRSYSPPPARSYSPPPARSYSPPAQSYAPTAPRYSAPAQHYSPPPAAHYSPPPAPPPSAPAQSAPPSAPARQGNSQDKER